MKNRLIFLCTMWAMSFGLWAHDLQISLSDANGYGWAPLSTTPHRITLYEKPAFYPLTETKINTSEYKGFKLIFKEIPSGIKILLRGEDKTGQKNTRLVDIKLVGTSMEYQFEDFASIDKIGLYYSGKSTLRATQVFVLNFLLLHKSGKETPTPLLNNIDAQKKLTSWSRLIGNSWDIVYSGNYIREIEWSPADFNKYNKLTIKFKEPIQTGIKLKIYKTKNGTSSSDSFPIPVHSKNFIFDLKSNPRLTGSTLQKLSLTSKLQGSKLKIDKMYLSE